MGNKKNLSLAISSQQYMVSFDWKAGQLVKCAVEVDTVLVHELSFSSPGRVVYIGRAGGQQYSVAATTLAPPNMLQLPQQRQVTYRFNAMLETFVSAMRSLQVLSVGEALHLGVRIKGAVWLQTSAQRLPPSTVLEAHYGPRDYPYVAKDPPPIIDEARTEHEVFPHRERMVGRFKGTEGDVRNLVSRAHAKYTPATYNCFRMNCITFASDMPWELNKIDMPQEFLGLDAQLEANLNWR